MSKKPPAPATVSEQLRQAILDSGLTLYRVAKDASVGYASLHRFVSGERTISQDVLDRLCASLDLVLRPARDK